MSVKEYCVMFNARLVSISKSYHVTMNLNGFKRRGWGGGVTRALFTYFTDVFKFPFTCQP